MSEYLVPLIGNARRSKKFNAFTGGIHWENASKWVNKDGWLNFITFNMKNIGRLLVRPRVVIGADGLLKPWARGDGQDLDIERFNHYWRLKNPGKDPTLFDLESLDFREFELPPEDLLEDEDR